MIVATLAGLLVGLWLGLCLLGGLVALAAALFGPWVRARWARRHPERAAARQTTRTTRLLASGWPLLARTLELGYLDPWTGEHRWPAVRITRDQHGLTALVAAIPGAGWSTTSAPAPPWPTPGGAWPCAPPSSAPGWCSCAAWPVTPC